MHNPLTKEQIPLGSSTVSSAPDHEDPAWTAWQRHVDARRIGSAPRRSFDQRVRLMRNEVALFGRVVTRELEAL